MPSALADGRKAVSAPIQIRSVYPADAGVLATCVNTCFRHESAAVEAVRVARILGTRGHYTRAAFSGDRMIGFCDSFATHAANTTRWEIDLLGVVPAERGMGIAQLLVQDSVSEGQLRGSTLARALVRRDNHAARAVFSVMEFAESDLQSLWVAAPSGARMAIEDVSAVCIPVSTLTYDGVWVEFPQDASALKQACGLAQDRSHVIGAVLPAKSDAEAWAEQAGYRHVGSYHWWSLPY